MTNIADLTSEFNARLKVLNIDLRITVADASVGQKLDEIHLTVKDEKTVKVTEKKESKASPLNPFGDGSNEEELVPASPALQSGPEIIHKLFVRLGVCIQLYEDLLHHSRSSKVNKNVEVLEAALKNYHECYKAYQQALMRSDAAEDLRRDKLAKKKDIVFAIQKLNIVLQNLSDPSLSHGGWNKRPSFLYAIAHAFNEKLKALDYIALYGVNFKQIARLNETIDQQEQIIGNQDRIIADQNESIENKEKQLEELKKEKKQSVGLQERQIQNKDERIQELQKENSELKQDLQKVTSENSSLKKQIDKIKAKANKLIADLENKLNKATEFLKGFKKFLSGILGYITSGKIEQAKTELTRRIEQLSDLEKQNSSLVPPTPTRRTASIAQPMGQSTTQVSKQLPASEAKREVDSDDEAVAVRSDSSNSGSPTPNGSGNSSPTRAPRKGSADVASLFMGMGSRQSPAGTPINQPSPLAINSLMSGVGKVAAGLGEVLFQTPPQSNAKR